MSPKVSRKRLAVALIGSLLAVILIAGTFLVGMRVGTARAFRQVTQVLRDGGDIEGLIAAQPSGMLRLLRKAGVTAPGEVVKVTGARITIAGPDGSERVLLIGPQTKVRAGGQLRTASFIRPGDHVVGIGLPTANKEMDLRVIRVLLRQQEAAERQRDSQE